VTLSTIVSGVVQISIVTVCVIVRLHISFYSTICRNSK